MIIKVLFLLFLFFLIRTFIIRFDYHDYFNICLIFIFLFISILFILNDRKIYSILLIILTISLILYSNLDRNSSDNSIIIIDGNINFNNMYKNKYSLSSLLSELKSKKITSLNNSLCAILKDGKLVLYYKKNNYKNFIPIVIDGKIDEEYLSSIKKDKNFLDELFKRNNCTLNNISLAFYYNSTFYIIKK